MPASLRTYNICDTVLSKWLSVGKSEIGNTQSEFHGKYVLLATNKEYLLRNSCFEEIHCGKVSLFEVFLARIFRIVRIFPYSVRMRENTDQKNFSTNWSQKSFIIPPAPNALQLNKEKYKISYFMGYIGLDSLHNPKLLHQRLIKVYVSLFSSEILLTHSCVPGETGCVGCGHTLLRTLSFR